MALNEILLIVIGIALIGGTLYMMIRAIFSDPKAPPKSKAEIKKGKE